MWYSKKYKTRFQSTLPRGERQRTERLLCLLYNFNPRSREGSDTVFHAKHLHSLISIHAPARGATKEVRKTLNLTLISIHAPARGATAFPFKILLTSFYFNPRSREGSDVNNARYEEILELFQSTLPRGERLQFYLKFTLCF